MEEAGWPPYLDECSDQEFSYVLRFVLYDHIQGKKHMHRMFEKILMEETNREHEAQMFLNIINPLMENQLQNESIKKPRNQIFENLKQLFNHFLEPTVNHYYYQVPNLCYHLFSKPFYHIVPTSESVSIFRTNHDRTREVLKISRVNQEMLIFESQSLGMSFAFTYNEGLFLTSTENSLFEATFYQLIETWEAFEGMHCIARLLEFLNMFKTIFDASYYEEDEGQKMGKQNCQAIPFYSLFLSF